MKKENPEIVTRAKTPGLGRRLGWNAALTLARYNAIGEIGAGSEIHEQTPGGLTLTTPEEAREFAASTGIDILAPAVGNSHGLSRSMLRGEAQKRLDIHRIEEIGKATGCFMTHHGALGTNNNDLKRVIRAGITEIHINTELRLAWRRGLEMAIKWCRIIYYRRRLTP